MTNDTFLFGSDSGLQFNTLTVTVAGIVGFIRIYGWRQTCVSKPATARWEVQLPLVDPSPCVSTESPGPL